MPRALWTGSLSFGLVNVPVGIYAATEDKAIRFNQFQKGTADRIRNRRVNERTGEEVSFDEIVKGYDLGGGEYVIITPEELAAVAPGPSRTIDISDFVDLGDIDPVYFDRPYYLAPQGKGSERAYALLLEAMATMGKVALGRFVMRDKQYLVAVRPQQRALVLETLHFADEVRDPVRDIDVLPVEATFEDREMEMAKLLIDSMTTAWDPDAYHDTYRQRVEDLIEAKRAGAVTVAEGPEPAPAPVVDLLAALEASVQAARGTAAPSAGRAGPAARRAPRAPRTASDGGASKTAAKKARTAAARPSAPKATTRVPATPVRAPRKAAKAAAKTAAAKSAPRTARASGRKAS